MMGTALRKSAKRRLVIVLCWATVAAAVSAAVRYGVVELEFFRRACGDEATMPLWCWPRQLLMRFLDFWLFGIVSVAIGMYALMRPSRKGWATTAVILGTVALVLYNAGPGSVAFVLGLATLARERV